ncbi:MAG: dihydrofolate reductase [Candidatus Moranbacteria bacterium]|nr:dihydrofolate reductase [Candidatus Moranbacteria bacterium]
MSKPIISIIVAIAKNNVIGKGNELPWNLPADLEYFKKTTSGHPVIMGYKTHLSIGRLLPGRKNIVLANDPELKIMDGALRADSFEKAFESASDSDEAFIIGGANVYKQGLNYADRLYITEVQDDVDGDVFFPDYDKSQWKEIKREKRKADDESQYDLDFVVYKKIK